MTAGDDLWTGAGFLDRAREGVTDAVIRSKVDQIVELTAALVEQERLPNPAQDPGLPAYLPNPDWTHGIPAMEWHQKFGQLIYADAASASAVATALASTDREYSGVVGGERNTIAEIRDRTLVWKGTAADNFTAYLGKMSGSIALQRRFIQSLNAIMLVQAELVEGTKQTANAIADDTISALQQRLDQVQAERTEDWVSMAKTLLGVASTVFAGPGKALAVFDGVKEAFSSSMDTTLSSAVKVEGASAKQITDAMERALDELLSIANGEQEKMLLAFKDLRAQLGDDVYRESPTNGDPLETLLPEAVNFDYGRGGGLDYGPGDFRLP